MKSDIEKTLKLALTTKKKLKLRMEGTSVGKYYLFHPHAVLVDKFTAQIDVFGLIEKDESWDGTLDGSFRRLAIEGLLEAYVQDDSFVPQENWKLMLKNLVVDFIETVDSRAR